LLFSNNHRNVAHRDAGGGSVHSIMRRHSSLAVTRTDAQLAAEGIARADLARIVFERHFD